MNEQIPDKQSLNELMIDVPSSSIPLVKIIEESPKILPDINALNKVHWGNKSNQLLEDYKYGEALAKYGNSNLSTKIFYTRFATALCSIISNEYQKRGFDSTELKPHYQLIDAAFQLIAKEIDKKDLKDFNILSIISAMQGFIINYNQPKEIK